MLSVVRLFFPKVYQDAHMLPSSPLDVTTVHKSEALKRLVKEKKEKKREKERKSW